ncbi:Hypothetical predicted protein, partial [Paramuricea clavata]
THRVISCTVHLLLKSFHHINEIVSAIHICLKVLHNLKLAILKLDNYTYNDVCIAHGGFQLTLSNRLAGKIHYLLTEIKSRSYNDYKDLNKTGIASILDRNNKTDIMRSKQYTNTFLNCFGSISQSARIQPIVYICVFPVWLFKILEDVMIQQDRSRYTTSTKQQHQASLLAHHNNYADILRTSDVMGKLNSLMDQGLALYLGYIKYRNRYRTFVAVSVDISSLSFQNSFSFHVSRTNIVDMTISQLAIDTSLINVVDITCIADISGDRMHASVGQSPSSHHANSNKPFEKYTLSIITCLAWKLRLSNRLQITLRFFKKVFIA